METITTHWLQLKIPPSYNASRERADILLRRRDSSESIRIIAIRNAESATPPTMDDAEQYAKGGDHSRTRDTQKMRICGRDGFRVSTTDDDHGFTTLIDSTILLLNVENVPTAEARDRFELVLRSLTLLPETTTGQQE